MKTMSKFFLIISAILLVIGIVIMIIGSVMAKKAGVQLFQEKVDGKYLYEVDLSEKDIAKISIDATDTDIILKTGEEKSYIEFINFNENYFSLTTTNKVVKFEEHVSLSSLISFWDGNFKFKGMRSFLSLGGSMNGQKQVIIHLIDTTDINVFTFDITDGDISIENAQSNTDYSITMNSGNVSFKNVTTDSKVMLNGNNCSVKFENCCIKYLASDIHDVDLTADITGVHSFEFTGNAGSVNAAIQLDSDKNDIRITNESDRPILYNGEEFANIYTNNENNAEVPAEYTVLHISGAEMTIQVSAEIPETIEEVES